MWGAGIRSLEISFTLNQVDFAPLLSSLLGITIPANNIGIFPLLLVNASSKYKFKAAYSNLNQVYFFFAKLGVINILYLILYIFH